MTKNEDIVRAVYASAEGKTLDADKFVSLFADDGYFLDIASGGKWIGKDVRQPVEGLAAAFPDMHRELLQVYSSEEGVVIVELRLQGTHEGDFHTPAGVVSATGKKFDVPCCDVFNLKHGKVEAFRCYNMPSIWFAQLGISGS